MGARELIVDAAARVMQEKGIARATTREIAREAGYSEALLYKHFADKQEIYLAVLTERLGPLLSATGMPGSATLEENLIALTAGFMDFYVRSFPMSASIFSDRVLLDSWRESMAARGAGPLGPVQVLERYIAAEVELGRTSVDPMTTAQLLCGTAFQQAFLACFDGLAAVPDAPALATRLVRAVLAQGSPD